MSAVTAVAEPPSPPETVATRWLIVSRAADLEPAQQLVGARYQVTTLQAASEHAGRRELDGAGVLLWPTASPQAIERMRNFAMELATDCTEVKFLDSGLPGGDSHTLEFWLSLDLDEETRFYGFARWARGEESPNAICYVQIIANPEQSISPPAVDHKNNNEIKGLAPINADLPPISTPRVDPNSDGPESTVSPVFSLAGGNLEPRGQDAESFTGSFAPGGSEPYDSDDAAAEAIASLNGFHVEQWEPLAVPLDGARSHAAPPGMEIWARPSDSAGVDPGWPEPVNFWGEPKLPELEARHLPAAVAPYILDQSDRAGVSQTMTAGFCLTSLAAAIRSGVEVRMHPGGGSGPDWAEKPVLWCAGIAEPSYGKGPAMTIAAHHFKEFADQLRQKNDHLWVNYGHQLKIHDKRLQAYYSEAAKNPGAQPPAAPEKPPSERLWADDATKEAIAKLLIDNSHGRRILILKDELASWFGSMGAYAGAGAEKDRADWLSFYESRERWIDRIKEGGSYHVREWGGPIMGCIQPSTLQKVAAKLGEDGMMQRFMLLIGTPKRESAQRRADQPAITAWSNTLSTLLAMEPRGNPITFAPDAQAFMAECVRWMYKAMQGSDNAPLAAALGKWEGLFGRLAITSHCVADAARGQSVPGPEISLATAQQVWAWMHEILWPHAVHFYSGMTQSSDLAISTRAFANFILARGMTGIRPASLTSVWTHYRRKLGTIQARKEFWDAMVNMGWVRPADGARDRTGTIAGRYDINPAVHEQFTAQAELARVRVEQFREVMPQEFGRAPGED